MHDILVETNAHSPFEIGVRSAIRSEQTVFIENTFPNQKLSERAVNGVKSEVQDTVMRRLADMVLMNPITEVLLGNPFLPIAFCRRAIFIDQFQGTVR